MLEVDLDKEEPLAILAADRLEEVVAADNLDEHEVVGRGEMVEVVLHHRRMRHPRDLITHHRPRPPPLSLPTPSRSGLAGVGVCLRFAILLTFGFGSGVGGLGEDNEEPARDMGVIEEGGEE